MRRSVFVGLLLLAACRQKETRPVVRADPPATPPIAQAVDAGPALVDLLHMTRATVAVSSNVDNPHDYPEHLVDGKVDTAWNGRSGDLVGGWIKLQIPDDARLETIEMTVGYDKVNADGDLFTMNHRIKRVRVLRNGKPIGEHTFDVDVRTPQPIAIGQAGGTFEIRVLETVPGTKTKWRELCVSELRAMGTAGSGALAKPAMPIVSVAMLPHELEKATNDAEAGVKRLLGRVFPSIDAFCKAWDAQIGPNLNARRASGETLVPANHACRAAGPLSASFTPNDEIKAVTKVVVFQINWSEDRFAIETPTGVVVPDVKPLDSNPFNDPGCFGSNTVKIDAVEALGKSVEVKLTDTWNNSRGFDDGDGGTSWTKSDDVTRANVACSPGGDRLKCTFVEMSRVCHIDGAVVDCRSF